MQQQPYNPPTSPAQIQDLASALIDALGIKVSQQGQKVQSLTIYLCKLFRKYSPQAGKKFNEVKMSRMNGFLSKVCRQIPIDKHDIELINQIIYCFLNNEAASLIDDSSFASNTCAWIADYIEDVLAPKFAELCVEMIQISLKIKKPTFLSLEQFEKRTTASPYFKDNQITKQDQNLANRRGKYKGFMSEYSIYNQIKQFIAPLKLFQILYNTHPRKIEIMKLFITFCRQTEVKDLKQTFITIFASQKIQKKQYLIALLNCLDSQFFATEDFNQILRLLLKNNDRKLFYLIPVQNVKFQHRYLEILGQDIKPNSVDEMADIFISEKEINNYYLLYLIHKSNQKLSERFLTLPTTGIVTNRHAIISAMCVNQNIENSHTQIIRYFFDNEPALSAKLKTDYLKLAHFSYIIIPKSHLLTNIIKFISAAQLDQQSTFQFLPREGYEKIQLSKNAREQLNQFLSRYFGNSDEIYWLKLSLHTICGNQLAYKQDFKEVKKIFEAPMETIINDLPTIAERLLEVVLMGVNNKYTENCTLNQSSVAPTTQWALDLYKKQYKMFKSKADTFLKKMGAGQLLELCLELFDFNLDQKSDLGFDDDFKIITNAQNSRKLVGLHFSEYFMMTQNEQNETINSLTKSKNMVIELQKLIKMLNNDGKTQNRKELKTLVSEESLPLRALKIIRSLSKTTYEKPKNPQKLKQLAEVLLSHVKPDFEFLTQLQARSNNVSIPYAPIYQSLEFLLTVNYEGTINFLAQLLKSKQTKVQQKQEKGSHKKKRKIGAQTDIAAEKNIQNIAENMQFCFKGDPNLLTSYSSIITIVHQIQNSAYSDGLAQDLSKWVSKIKIFHKDKFKEWKQKVSNYIKLWEAIAPVVSSALPIKQVERHFLIMIELLNILYEKHKQEKEALCLQKKLLNGLLILYNLSQSTGIQMQPESKDENIPRQKLAQCLMPYQLPQINVPHIFYCFDCSMKVCHECATIIHRIHDKNYIGPGNQSECHRFGNASKNGNKEKQDKGKKDRGDRDRDRDSFRQAYHAIYKQRDRDMNAEKNRMIKQKYIQKLLREGGMEELDRERGKQIERHYMLISQGDRLPPQVYMRLKQQKGASRKNDKPNIFPQTDSFDFDFDEQRKKSESPEEPQKMEIKSCTQKEFIIKPRTLVDGSTHPKPTLLAIQANSASRNHKISISPLFNLLIRQLKSNSFYQNSDADAEMNQIKSAINFQAQISNQKYTLMKIEEFKPNNMPSGMGSIYLRHDQPNNPPMLQSIAKRNTIALNQKLLVILSGGYMSQVHCLDANLLKSKFLKRESQKRYKETEALESYLYHQSKISQPSVLDVEFSPFAHNLIAEIAPHKILFEQISKQGRNRLISYEQAVGTGEVTKFQWIKCTGLRSYFIYLTQNNNNTVGDVVISRIEKGQSNSGSNPFANTTQLANKLVIKLQNKYIRDFTTSIISSKIFSLTLLDGEGKLYRTKIDVSNKRVPNFIDYPIPVSNLANFEQILTVTCQGNFIFCTTNLGKLVIMSTNDENNLMNPPMVFPMVENLRSHKISEVSSIFKEVNRIIKLRYITKFQNQIYFAALLIKDVSPLGSLNPGNSGLANAVASGLIDGMKFGHFVILSANQQNKKTKIVFFNDQGKTHSFSHMSINEKQYMFICLQMDGQIWSCKLNAMSKSSTSKLTESTIMLPMSLNDILLYKGEIDRFDLLSQLQFYDKQRKPTFKQHTKITDHFKISAAQSSTILFEVNEKSARAEFPTGIQFGYTHNSQADGPASNICFTFLGNTYRYLITKTREIQIPMTIRQVLGVYLGIQEMKIRFIQGNQNNNVNIKDIVVFGVKVTEKSVYFEALNNLCEIMYIYQCPKDIKDPNTDKKIERYLLNENKKQITSFEHKQLEEYFGRKKFTLTEQNLLLKLQLLRESIESGKIQNSLLYDCYESIRSHVLPYCFERKQLFVSAKKLCQTLTSNCQDVSSLKLGHVLNSDTQLDLYSVFKLHKLFRSDETIESYQQLLCLLCKILNIRTVNGFILLSVYPEIVKQLCKFFKKILVQYKLFFKVNELGLQKQEKLRINKICSYLMRILIEFYQLQKNKKSETKINCEQQILLTLESIFCLSKKQVHKQIKLNPFQYLQSVFEDGRYIHQSPSINYLILDKVQVQVQKKNIQQSAVIDQSKLKLQDRLPSNRQQSVSQNDPSLDFNEDDILQAEIQIEAENENDNENQQIGDISCEQHKQRQQLNRDILEEFAYEMIPQNNVNINDGLNDDNSQDHGQGTNKHAKVQHETKSAEIDTKKVYEYLSKSCTSMLPQQIRFHYYGICQNLIIEIFSSSSNDHQKYLNSDNLVFYVGLIFNLLQIIQKKIENVFFQHPRIDFGHPYIQNNIVPLIEAIDSKLDNPSFSVLYLPLSSIIAANPKHELLEYIPSALVQCFVGYYSSNLANSKLLKVLTSSLIHPEVYKPASSLSSAFRFEFFGKVNPIYQLKFAGNMYLHLIRTPLDALQKEEQKIEENALKVVVKYGLRVYHNIVVKKQWTDKLEKMKVHVAFETLQKNPEDSLKVIMKSITKDIKSFVQDASKDNTKISCLEELLGSSGTTDELVLQILNSYYSYGQANN